MLKSFAICKEFAVPVDDIKGIYFDRVHSKLIVETNENKHSVGDASEAVNFLRSFEEEVDVNAAGMDDLVNSARTLLS